MCELLNKKIKQTKDMADHSGEAQAVCVSDLGTYDITPLKRCNGAKILMTIAPGCSSLIDSAQRDQLVAMLQFPGTKLSKMDAVEAAYALGFRTAENALRARTTTHLEQVIVSLGSDEYPNNYLENQSTDPTE